jgi:stage V sporulation protein R
MNTTTATTTDRPAPGPKLERLPSPSDWTFELIATYHAEIAKTAKGFGLDTYPNQLEVITAEQMMDAYASVGMPMIYRHWSYGKQFIATEKNYKRGHMGLAYEIVINSDPCIAYLMEENTMAMQALVIAHAAYGHNSFFKGNYLFRMWTDASSIIDYLVYARHYIAECEERHGLDAVEELLDSCHALMNYGVDRYRRPQKRSLAQESVQRADRERHMQQQVNDLWRTLPKRAEQAAESDATRRFPSEPQENLLYFIEKNAALLEPWQREVVRIVRKIAQYFYPQRQTQVMNEGWATFWHYTLLNTMYERGQLADGFMMEWLSSHTGVIFQPPVGHRAYSGINPYALGFAMFTELRRICEKPTEEDRRWFPDYRRHRLGHDARLCHAQLQGRELHRPVLEPQDHARLPPVRGARPSRATPNSRSRPSTTTTATRRCANRCPASTTSAAASPTSRCGTSTCGATARSRLRTRSATASRCATTRTRYSSMSTRLWGFDVRLESVDSAGRISRSWKASAPKQMY